MMFIFAIGMYMCVCVVYCGDGNIVEQLICGWLKDLTTLELMNEMFYMVILND